MDLSVPSSPILGAPALTLHTSQDAAGKSAVGHTAMTEVAGLATPVSTLSPMPVLDQASAAYSGVVALTATVPAPAGRSLGYVCSAPGTLTLSLADGSSISLPVVVGGFATLPFAVVAFSVSNGAAGQFWNLK